jgi:hypothetical protein
MWVIIGGPHGAQRWAGVARGGRLSVGLVGLASNLDPWPWVG